MCFPRTIGARKYTSNWINSTASLRKSFRNGAQRDFKFSEIERAFDYSEELRRKRCKSFLHAQGQFEKKDDFKSYNRTIVTCPISHTPRGVHASGSQKISPDPNGESCWFQFDLILTIGRCSQCPACSRWF